LSKASVELRLENLALRHQLAVLRRSAPKRLNRNPPNGFFGPDWRSAPLIVKPGTVIAWHRKGFQLYWIWKVRRGKHG
jgi:putative transposase